MPILQSRKRPGSIKAKEFACLAFRSRSSETKHQQSYLKYSKVSVGVHQPNCQRTITLSFCTLSAEPSEMIHGLILTIGHTLSTLRPIFSVFFSIFFGSAVYNTFHRNPKRKRGQKKRPSLTVLKLRSFGHCNPKRKRGTKLEEYRDAPR